MLTGIIIVIVIAVIIALFFVVSYNGFIKAKNNCEEAFSTMDVYMNRRPGRR